MPGPFTTPVAQSVPMENKDSKDNDFKSINVQEGLEEIDFRREQKEPTGFTEISEVEIHLDEVTNVLEVIPTGASYSFYIRGERFEKTATDTIALPQVTGVYFVYYGTDGNLSYTTYPTQHQYDDPYFAVAISVYNDVQGKAIHWSYATSTVSMPWGTQRRIARTLGAQHAPNGLLPQNFIENGTGMLDSHAQLGFSNGTIYSHDLKFPIIHSLTPSEHWEQTIESIAKIPIYYKIGVGSNAIWYKKEATTFPMYENVGNNISYNDKTGGVYSLQIAPDNVFVVTYFFATLNPHEPIVGVIGDRYGNSPSQALNEALQYMGDPFLEVTSFIKAAIWQTGIQFTNTPRARLYKLVDVVNTVGTDRYMVQVFYGGNANTGRYLEYLQGTDSVEQPLLVPEDSFIRTITLQASANTGIGRSISFYEASNLVTPRFTVTTTTNTKEHQWDVTEFFLKSEQIVVKVTNGAINKPTVRMWIETNP